TKEVLSNATKIVKDFKNPIIGEENLRDGNGVYSNEELSYENDPVAKWLGKSKRSKRQQQEYGQRIRERMVERAKVLATQLNLDNVEIVTEAFTLEGKKARAKGWFSPKTGKIERTDCESYGTKIQGGQSAGIPSIHGRKYHYAGKPQ
ncbi:SNF2 family protein, partial [gut metagenome]